ncbi:MAG: hypothetical protein GX130_12630 [Candidatus Hydrogenedens sp.]|nr:hypothetical protein [Candidatus Hydrogenedens sp.]
MVSSVVLCMLLSTLCGGDAPDLSLHFREVEAVRDSGTGKEYDQGCKAIRDALHDLPFDRFTMLSDQKLTLKAGEEKRLSLNTAYSLCLRYEGVDDSGRSRLAVTVELTESSPGRKVVETVLLLAPNKKARIGGLRKDPGELVLVFSTP